MGIFFFQAIAITSNLQRTLWSLCFLIKAAAVLQSLSCLVLPTDSAGITVSSQERERTSTKTSVSLKRATISSSPNLQLQFLARILKPLSRSNEAARSSDLLPSNLRAGNNQLGNNQPGNNQSRNRMGLRRG